MRISSVDLGLQSLLVAPDFSGPFSTSSVGIFLKKIGNIVTVQFGGFSSRGNVGAPVTKAVSVGAIPEGFRTPYELETHVTIKNADVYLNVPGSAVFYPNGDIEIYADIKRTATFNSSDTTENGWRGFSICYGNVGV